MDIEYGSYLEHYGRKGMKWYQHLFGEADSRAQYSNKSPSSLSDIMKKEIKYSDFNGLKSHDEVASSKSGDCHSQVMYEMEELKKLGYEPKAKFFIEVDPKTGQGGTTHSFAYYSENGKVNWFENAWGGQEGIHSYDNEASMLKDIEKKHFSEQTDKSKSELIWGDFVPEHHKPGESLQELVDICLDEDDKLKHSVFEIGGFLEHYGRKGMKWYQHLFGDEDSRGKYNKYSAKNADFFKKSIYEASQYSFLDYKDVTIPKGSTLYRISMTENEKNEGIAYVSMLESDRNHYYNWAKEGELGNKDQSRDNMGYEHKLEVTSDVKIPSYKTVLDTTVDAVLSDIDKMWKSSDISESDKKLTNRYLKFLDSKDSTDVEKSIGRIFANYFQKSPEKRDAIMKSLQKQGYNAMFDYEDMTLLGADNDRSKRTLAPMILFDRASTVKESGVTDLDKDKSLDYKWHTRESDERTMEKYRNKSIKHSGEGGEDMTEWEARQDELEHYGRLGMKWYQHRFGEEDGRAKYTDKARNKEIEKSTKQYDKKVKKLGKQASKDERKGRTDEAEMKRRSIANIEKQKEREFSTVMAMSFDNLLAEQKETRRWRASEAWLNYTMARDHGIARYAASKYMKNVEGKPTKSSDYKTRRRTGSTTGETVANTRREYWDEKQREYEERNNVKHDAFGQKVVYVVDTPIRTNGDLNHAINFVRKNYAINDFKAKSDARSIKYKNVYMKSNGKEVLRSITYTKAGDDDIDATYN